MLSEIKVEKIKAVLSISRSSRPVDDTVGNVSGVCHHWTYKVDCMVPVAGKLYRIDDMGKFMFSGEATPVGELIRVWGPDTNKACQNEAFH